MNSTKNPTCSGTACSGNLNEDVWNTYSSLDDFQSNTHCDDLLQDVLSPPDFCFHSVVACDEDRPVAIPLAPGVTGLDSPPSTPSNAAGPTFHQHPCAETGIFASPCNSAMLDDVYPDALDTQQFPVYTFFQDNSAFASSSSSPFFAQDVDGYTSSPYSVASPETPPAASSQVLEGRVLKRRVSPKGGRTKSQQKVHRCESRTAKAQYSFEQTTCDQTFARLKDLKRHRLSVHREDNDPVYYCRCGKDDPRKDNHLRHVEACGRPHSRPSYLCKCSHSNEERQQHLDHVKVCIHNFGRRGRPPALQTGA